MTARHTLPTTTAYPREDLYRFVNQLNVRYNVGVPILDPNLSLAEQREDQSPASRIYRRLEVHFHAGGILALDGLLHQFDEGTKEFLSNWVKKPDTDADTLPRPTFPPLAVNLTQRDWLQSTFNKILDTAQPARESRSLGRVQSGPAAFSGHADPNETSPADARMTRSHVKRHAEAEPENKVKRTKSEFDPIKELTASYSLNRRQPVDTSASASSAMRPPPRTTPVGFSGLFRSFATTSTVISAASAVFSESGNGLLGTQDSIESGSQEQLRPPLKATPGLSSQESYGMSSSLEASLHRSYDHQQSSEKLAVSATRQVKSTCESEVQGKINQDLGLLQSNSGDFEFASMPADAERDALRPMLDLHSALKAHGHGLPHIWPQFPSRRLRDAPYPIVWELQRICQSCGVDLTSTDLVYSPDWRMQTNLRASLQRHPAFQDKALPEASSDDAWAAGLRADEQRKAGLQKFTALTSDQGVVYSASLDFGSRWSTPLQLRMQPLKLDQSHRLARKYGADRFLEVLIPSPDSSNLPAPLNSETSFFERLTGWLDLPHQFCGRSWVAFYTKSGGSRKPVRDLHFGPKPKPVFTDRIFLFAESAEAESKFEKMRLSMMLRWALEIDQKDNASQPVLKLFQRQALVLSRNTPAITFKQEQIVHLTEDLLSPTSGAVMNDGVGRMSPAVAREIRAALGLTVPLSAVQGRLGSAKGMWILNTNIPASSEEIRIEVYPSQRKWIQTCSPAVDEHHRTLEIRNFASLPKSASFNLQFLPVIEDRAADKAAMRKAIGHLLKTNLQKDIDGQKRALQTRMQFLQWVYESATHRHERIIHGHVPYQGGMPQEEEEMMTQMLLNGFHPERNRMLKNVTYEIQKRKCETLMKKLNITVGRSAYLYMVVDFLGVLEENEVHIGFSTAFQAAEDWSKTMIHGTDVLVARSPSHFTSDIQKVQAVFKAELADLTDVVVFSSKGGIPLAEKLSGGDYDGDLAWVCWEKCIVDNFQNAAVTEQPDLSAYMLKDNETFRDLVKTHGNSRKSAVKAMIAKSFTFNLSKSMLGPCTNYKERLCYVRNSVDDTPARTLSTLLSSLVDQPKQGNHFTAVDFSRLLRDLHVPSRVDDPLYKQDYFPKGKMPIHIIDYLKFEVAQPTVKMELQSFHDALRLNDKALSDWDDDLVSFYKSFKGQAEVSKLLMNLKDDIKAVRELWRNGPLEEGFPEKVSRVYSKWQDIQPRWEGGRTGAMAGHWLLYGGEHSIWGLLKASVAFYMYCNNGGDRSPRFVWQMAFSQLCRIKTLSVAERSPRGAVGAPLTMIPSMYAALRPDTKYIKQRHREDGGPESI